MRDDIPATRVQIDTIKRLQRNEFREGEPTTPDEVLETFPRWKASRWIRALAAGERNPEYDREDDE